MSFLCENMSGIYKMMQFQVSTKTSRFSAFRALSSLAICGSFENSQFVVDEMTVQTWRQTELLQMHRVPPLTAVQAVKRLVKFATTWLMFSSVLSRWSMQDDFGLTNRLGLRLDRWSLLCYFSSMAQQK